MPQIPEQIRPYITLLVKYHFWIMAALVPLLLLPPLFLGTNAVATLIAGQQSQIESRIAAVKSVRAVAPHPNDAWAKAVDEHTQKIRDETLAEWTRLWEDQEFLRLWPAKLGVDFSEAVSSLKPGGSLKRPFLLRYQNTVPDLVRELPFRMGTDDLMAEQSAKGGAERPATERSATGGPRAFVTWKGIDQKRLFDTFKWEKPPTTVQVLLAQEELWVYGLLCDAIKRANAQAAGVYNAPIISVEELAVGYPAAEERPGGQGAGRVIVRAAAPAEGTEGAPAAAPDGASARPLHPRFGGGSAANVASGAAEGAAGAESADNALREWIYVDFTGKPLTAAELAAAPASKMVHLMPFVLRVVMDQRAIDALLADFAAARVPIDVRQVRISTGTAEMSTRPYDVLVEFRGTVGLAVQPDPALFGGEAAPSGGGDA
jgi:hypothetical protein